MADDAYYEARVRAWVGAAQSRKAKRPRAHPGNYHCQWFEAVRAARANATAREHTTWSQCACPKGHRNEFESAAERNRLRRRWLPTCRTASE